jgi:hypothetical protein
MTLEIASVAKAFDNKPIMAVTKNTFKNITDKNIDEDSLNSFNIEKNKYNIPDDVYNTKK